MKVKQNWSNSLARVTGTRVRAFPTITLKLKGEKIFFVVSHFLSTLHKITVSGACARRSTRFHPQEDVH